MVDLTLTDQQEDIREMAHDFAEKEIRPVAWEFDKDGTCRRGSSRRRGS
jgi:acyl-CoA dehydrogenase